MMVINKRTLCGVWDQSVGASLRHLPTAGVCDQGVGASLRHFPTAGVCDQRVGASLRHLPNAGVCDQRVGVSLRHLPTAGVCDQPVVLHCRVVFHAGTTCTALKHSRCLSPCLPWCLVVTPACTALFVTRVHSWTCYFRG